MNRLTFIREASSRIYSPYVFAIGQLLGEIPYSVLCALIYWVLMVSFLVILEVPHKLMRLLGISDALRSRICWHEWHWIPVPYYLDHGAVRCNPRSANRVHLAKYPDRFPLHTANPDHSY